MSDLPTIDIEGLLKQAFAPIEPPHGLSTRLETRLSAIHEEAAGELEGWEITALADPSQWGTVPRVAAAAAVTAGAGAALVVLRVRGQHRKRAAAAKDPLHLAETTLRAVADETRKLLDR